MSIACHFLGLLPVPLAMVGINRIAWLGLGALTIRRALRFRPLMMREIS